MVAQWRVLVYNRVLSHINFFDCSNTFFASHFDYLGRQLLHFGLSWIKRTTYVVWPSQVCILQKYVRINVGFLVEYIEKVVR